MNKSFKKPLMKIILVRVQFKIQVKIKKKHVSKICGISTIYNKFSVQKNTKLQ